MCLTPANHYYSVALDGVVTVTESARVTLAACNCQFSEQIFSISLAGADANVVRVQLGSSCLSAMVGQVGGQILLLQSCGVHTFLLY